MSLPIPILYGNAEWMGQSAPQHHIVLSSRARFARNLAHHPFSPHAPSAMLEQVRDEVRTAFGHSARLAQFLCVEMTEATARERGFLKEARLISREMERGGASRAVYVAPDLKSAILVNEEDHLRLQCLEPGLQLGLVGAALRELERESASVLAYAYHPRFGFLTACPTNVGTGMRMSVMMHLPGLAIRREDEAVLKTLSKLGQTVRGFHGENSEVMGDIYQISNEVTLGVTVEEIEARLADSVALIMAQETEARSLLLREKTVAVYDAIWRAYGLLSHARRLTTAEAMKLLSKLRLGIEGDIFPGLTHEVLNRLVMEVQPGHLMLRRGAPEEEEKRDVARATLVREALGAPKGETPPKP